MQRLRLLLFRDGAHDGLTYNIAAAVNHIGSGIGKDVRGELASLTVGSEIHILIGCALLGQYIFRFGNCLFVAIQREGVDADECAALLRKLLVQRVQFGKLTHAGIAGGKPEIHHGDGIAGEQIVALHRIPIQILALKSRKLLHAAVIRRRGHIAARGHAHSAVHGLLHDLGVFVLQFGQPVFDIADLRGRLLQPLELRFGELILCGLNGVKQEVAVVFAVFDLGHALVSLHKNLFPQLGVLREEGVLLFQELFVQGERLVSVFRLVGHDGAVSASLCLLAVVVCAAGGKRQCQQHRQNQRDQFLHVHFDSSMLFVFFVVFSPSPKP